jgi:hypothetical protein
MGGACGAAGAGDVHCAILQQGNEDQAGRAGRARQGVQARAGSVAGGGGSLLGGTGGGCGGCVVGRRRSAWGGRSHLDEV